jgi:hypothetical protein
LPRPRAASYAVFRSHLAGQRQQSKSRRRPLFSLFASFGGVIPRSLEFFQHLAKVALVSR